MERGEASASGEPRNVRWRRLTEAAEELERRLRYVAATRADWLSYKRGSSFDPPLRVAGTRRPPRFFFSPREVPGICAIWRLRLAPEAGVTAAQAERICQHRLDLLGYENVACGVEIDWHCDHVHNSRAPLKPWYKLRHLQNESDLAQAGDCRIVWALNRHQHLVTLAKAYRLTGNRKFAAEVFQQWAHWHKHNPYPLGLNWVSTQQVARRSLSWLWIYFLLVNTPELPRGFRAEWLRGLYVSGRHIERYALQHGISGTHLLSEGVALFFIGILCPELVAAETWKQRGWQLVLDEMARLGRAGAVGFELSSSHHLQTIDLLLHACILAAANEIPVPHGSEATLEKMLDVLCLLGRAGPPPRLGADDGDRLFNPARNRAEHMIDPLATGAVLFGRGDFKSLAGGMREETLWLLGEAGVQEFDQLAMQAPAPGSISLATAGLYLSADAARNEQLVIDARSAPNVASQAGPVPALAISINRSGQPLIVDPGDPARVPTGGDGQVSGSPGLHNTLLVDWTEPGERSDPLQATRSATVKVESWISGRTFDLFAGRHESRGTDQDWEHQRSVFSLRSQFWLVRDLATGAGTHRVGVFWHLNSELLRHGGGAGVLAETADLAGLRIMAAEDHGWSQDIRQGWWSPAYGQRQPLNVLQFSTVTAFPAEFVTLLAPVANAYQSEGRLRMIEDSSGLDLVRGYRYEVDGNEHCMFFGHGQPWALAEWSSDAQFLYWGDSHDRTHRVLACCKGTYVERQERRVISCAKLLERCELVISGDQMDVFSSDSEAQVSKRALDGPVTEIAPEPVPEVPVRRRLRKAAGQ